MSRLSTAFILGYHGCDAATADRAVIEGAAFLQSSKDYDWLGPGAYFWESDPVRALEWARWKVEIGHYNEPAVVGAVIDLGNCLNLVSREDVELLRGAHRSFVRLQKAAGQPLPKNRNPKGVNGSDRLLRYLDCAVVRHLHEIVASDSKSAPFDTVRGMFVEGGRAYGNSGIYRKSHVQIAVRSMSCIKGVFFHRETEDAASHADHFT